MLVDTHCHLDSSEFDNDRMDVIKRAKESGINYIVNIGSSIQGSEDSVSLAVKYDSVYAAVGVHPHEADRLNEDSAAIIKNIAQNKKVVAIGEIGLDYYKNYSKQENQKPLFISLLKVARELNLAVVLHSRDADYDMLNIINDFLPLKAVVHCFSGDSYFLKKCLELGLLVSFTCNITYKKAQRLRDMVKEVPLERMMLETDAPYLSPEGFRGKRNEPFGVKLLAEAISQIRNEPLEVIEQTTTSNAISFFNLK